MGQDALIQGILKAIIADGHILVESLPGLGKTLLVKTLSQALGLAHKRIQFTPDLMPSDITGSHIFNMAEQEFQFQPGPIFTQFLLADELNRSPAKTHSALLEAMQEKQVTMDNRRYVLEPPFIVMATQNPIESEGTYNLPEAALDRFLVKVQIDYPTDPEEQDILRGYLSGRNLDRAVDTDVEQVLSEEQLKGLQELAEHVHVSDEIIAYVTSLVRATRGNTYLFLGASPRASIALLKIARASALMDGRLYTVPDDVASSFLPVLRHRVMLSPEAEIEGRTTDSVLEEVIAATRPPQPKTI